MCSSHFQIFVFFVVGCTASPLEPYFRSDYKYVSRQDAFYKVGRTGERWKEAYARCAAEGAQLAYPRSEAEAALFVTLMTENLPKSANSMWVGAHDQFAEGVYQNLDGEDISDMYDNWHSGEPNDASFNEDCVSISRDTTINDVNCNSRLPAICKKSSHSILASNPTCETVDTGVPDHVPFFRKEYIYDSGTKNFYKLHKDRRNWFDAINRCKLEGAALLVPESKADRDAAVKILNEKFPAYPGMSAGYNTVWIGISDHISEGDFVTIDGRSINKIFIDWANGEPNNNNNEDCGVLRTTGKMNDVECDVKAPYICKKSRASVEWNNLCELPDLKYSYDHTLDKCYKLHLTPKNWNAAYEVCTAEDSYLAVIDSKEEAEHLVRLVNEAIKNKSHFTEEKQDHKLFLSNAVYLGFHKHFLTGWTTVNGQDFHKVGYSSWADGQPDQNGKELCGSMFLNGTLNDLTCEHTAIFICEHDLEASSFPIDERFNNETSVVQSTTTTLSSLPPS